MKFHTNQIVKMINTLDNKFHNQCLLGEDVLVVRCVGTIFDEFPLVKVLDKDGFAWYVAELQMKLVE